MARGSHVKRSAAVIDTVRSKNRKAHAAADSDHEDERASFLPKSEHRKSKGKGSRSVEVKIPVEVVAHHHKKGKKRSSKYVREEDLGAAATSEEEDEDEEKKKPAKRAPKKAPRKASAPASSSDEDSDEDEDEEDEERPRHARRHEAEAEEEKGEPSESESESDDEEEEEPAPAPRPAAPAAKRMSDVLKVQIRADKTEAEKARERRERAHRKLVNRNARLRTANAKERHAIRYFSGRQSAPAIHMRESAFRRMLKYVAPADAEVHAMRRGAVELLERSLQFHLLELIARAQDARLMGRTFKSAEEREAARKLEPVSGQLMLDVATEALQAIHPGLVPIQRAVLRLLRAPLDREAEKARARRQETKWVAQMREDVQWLAQTEHRPTVWNLKSDAEKHAIQAELVRKSNCLHTLDIASLEKRIKKSEAIVEKTPERVAKINESRPVLAAKVEGFKVDIQRYAGHHEAAVKQVKKLKAAHDALRKGDPTVKQLEEATKTLREERKKRDALAEKLVVHERKLSKARAKLAAVNEDLAKEEAKGKRHATMLALDARTEKQRLLDEKAAKRKGALPAPKPVSLRDRLANLKKELALGARKAKELGVEDPLGTQLRHEMQAAAAAPMHD